MRKSGADSGRPDANAPSNLPGGHGIPPRTGAVLVGLSRPGYFLGYTVSREAWYADAVASKDEVLMVALHHEGGGVAWEFSIHEVPLGRGRSALRVKLFDEAWEAFTVVPDLFAGLSDLGRGATFEEVVELLKRCGFRDATERETPARVLRQAAQFATGLAAGSPQTGAHSDALPPGEREHPQTKT